MAEEDLEQTPPPETPVETPPAAGKESIYILKERYTIDFSSPMVWLDTNGAKAYKVEDKINDKRELFALVCNNVTSPRSSLLPYLKSIDHQSIMKLVEYGVISYPVENSRNMRLFTKRLSADESSTAPEPTASRISRKNSKPFCFRCSRRWKYCAATALPTGPFAQTTFITGTKTGNISFSATA